MLLQKLCRQQARAAKRLRTTQQRVVTELHVGAAHFTIATLAGDSDRVATCWQVPGLAGLGGGGCSGHGVDCKQNPAAAVSMMVTNCKQICFAIYLGG